MIRALLAVAVVCAVLGANATLLYDYGAFCYVLIPVPLSIFRRSRV